MQVYCTRPKCPRPLNHCPDLDDAITLKTVQQKYCTSCGMPLLLDGRYVPFKLLKRGGFGAAFFAGDRRIPGMRPCVVKQFLPSENLTPEQLETAERLFETEAEVLADIGEKHEQIPKLFAYFPVLVASLYRGKQEQFFYLVQEYIDGQNLEDELRQTGKFSSQQALEVLQEILKILEFIHQKNIIHRDIKPSNIMRRRDGKLFLLDFGAVKQVTTAHASSLGSSTGIFTLGFAAPEQIAGNRVYPATDIYGLGATILNLLTGEEPNQFLDPLKVTSINQDLGAILHKMLSPAVNQRYPSAQAVLEALNQHLTSPQTSQSIFKPATTHRAFATWELLAGAAFSGFEGALMAIALFSFTKSPIITLILASIISGLLIFAQTRRWIEKIDLLIIAGLSFAVLFLIIGTNLLQVILLPIAAALVSISAIASFRLFYKLLSQII